MTQTKNLKVGLIGLGNMGRNHLRVLSILKNVSIAFIYDIDKNHREEMAALYGVATDNDLNNLLSKSLDAVIICTPTSTHSEMIRISAQYVSNIFVEKPLSHDLESTIADASFIRKRGLNVQVGFIERFNPAVQQLKAVLGKSEKVISLDFIRTNKLSSRIKDVDVITDLMIHDIDLAIYMNGGVISVTAQGIAEDDLIGFASAQLVHENGSFSRVQASRITEKKMRRISATCSDIFVDCELLRKELIVHKQSQIEQEKNGPYSITAVEQTIEVRQQEALLSEMQAFIDSCMGLETDVPDVSDALNAASVCDQIQKAILN